MFFRLQLIGNSVGNVTDAQLDGGAVLYQGGHIFADGGIYLRIGGGVYAENGAVRLYQCRYLRDVHHGVTEGAGIVGVYFHKKDSSGPHHIHFVDGADGKGHIAPCVHGRYGCKQHRAAAFIADAIQSLAQDAGGVLRYGTYQTLGVGLAQTCGEEPAVVCHDSLHFRVVKHGIVHRGDAALQNDIFYTGVLKMLQLTHQCIRAGGGHGCENKVSALNVLQHLPGGHFLAVVFFLISVHKRSFPCLAEFIGFCPF